MDLSYLLIALGLFLCMAEVFVPGFIVIWFGIGALIIGVSNLLTFKSADMIDLLAASSAVGLALLFALRNRILKAQEQNEVKINNNFLEESGDGVYRDGVVEFKGTFLKAKAQESGAIFENNEVVCVVSVENNVALIDKK